MRRYISVLIASFAVSGMLSAQDRYNVKVFPEKEVAAIDGRFWGTNFLYWIEDDEALADGRIGKALRELPCRILRYPGGTVADNYHWKTNLLDNNCMFPYEEGEEQSDFDEFMSFCTEVGAEPMLVVNTQSWFLKDDIEGGAEEAADWVRYCKEKGYRVKYWEIGNETYWHPVMTAKEYGRLVKVYAQAMKAVDPDILVSANGHWDVDCVGTKERIPEDRWDEIRQGYFSFSTREDYMEHKKSYEKLTAKPVTSGTDKWWPDLLSECGDVIDMISVHWYYFDNQIPNIEKELGELADLARIYSGKKEYLMCLSEYNCNTLGMEQRMPGLAESVGRFLNSGVDISCFWPLRIGGAGSAKGNRNMLGLESKEQQYPYQIFSLFQKYLKGSMVRCSFPDGVYAFASSDGESVTVVISGRCLGADSTVVLDPGIELTGRDISVASYFSDTSKISLEERHSDYRLTKKGLSITVSPESFVIVVIR